MRKVLQLGLLFFLCLGLWHCESGTDNTQDCQDCNKAYLDQRFPQPFKKEGDQTILYINTKSEWSIDFIGDHAQDWISLDGSRTGKGNAIISLFIAANKQPEFREARIKVSFTSGQAKLISIRQNGLEETAQDKLSHLKMELPRLSSKKTHRFVAHYADYAGKRQLNYCLEYDLERNHSRWVALRFDALSSAINTQRSNLWGCDPYLPERNCYNSSFRHFKGKRMDRGHLVASADRLFSREANIQTFYYSNISPQVHEFNSGIWADLENMVRSWGRNRSFCDTLYVVKGGTIRDDQLLGEVKTYHTAMRVPVPKYYFMAILKVKNKRYHSIGFMLPNEASSKSLREFKLSINALEERTALDFFCLLEDALEEEVESEVQTREWPGL